MAFTFRNQRQGYDNISAGNATGQERTIIGVTGLGGDCTTRPTKDRVGTAIGATSTISKEWFIKQPSTDDNTVQETHDTSNTSYTGMVSGTSYASVVYELFGSSNIPGNVS